MSEFETWWHEIGSGIIPRDGDDMEEHAKRVCKEYSLHLYSRIEEVLVGSLDEISGERSYNADGTLPLQPEPDPDF